MRKATKIIATIGPATSSVEIIEKLIEAGMNIARFNTKHSDPTWHKEHIDKVKTASLKLGIPVPILLDLQGPEIRIDVPNEKPLVVKDGEIVNFTSHKEPALANEQTVFIPQEIAGSLSVDSLILIDDGRYEFIITQLHDSGFKAQATSECEVDHRKTMNTPGAILDMPSITARDITYLDALDPQTIDFIGLSFVRDKNDLDALHHEMKKRNIKAAVIAKIENQAALDNLDDIIQNSDAIMIARGDLGVEVDYQQLVYWQKYIINKCLNAAKPVITATQMLKSMVNNPRPTRAEVSDVAHAIYDGTDAVMLSEETTIGKYPVEAVKIQASIALYNEQHTDYKMRWPANISSSLDITSNAANLLNHSKQTIDKIVCLTETGRTARLLARFRPKLPIFAVTNQPTTYQELTLPFGVYPFLMDFPEGKIEPSLQLIEQFKKHHIVETGETILLIYGSIWKKPGLTNTLSLIEIS